MRYVYKDTRGNIEYFSIDELNPDGLGPSTVEDNRYVCKFLFTSLSVLSVLSFLIFRSVAGEGWLPNQIVTLILLFFAVLFFVAYLFTGSSSARYNGGKKE